MGLRMSDRRRYFDLRRQARLLTPLLGVWFVGLTLITIAALQTRIPMTSLFLDPAALSKLPWYVGLLSNLGVLAWTVAAASAIGGAWVAQQTNRPSAARFLGWGGLAATLLLLDDLFLLHSSAIPKTLGVSKVVGLAIVIAPTLIWLGRFAHEIVRTRWLILVSALSCFAFSVSADQALTPGTTSLLLEDGAKLLGVLAWMAYFVITTHDIARSTINAAMRKDPIAELLDDEHGTGAEALSLREALDR